MELVIVLSVLVVIIGVFFFLSKKPATTQVEKLETQIAPQVTAPASDASPEEQIVTDYNKREQISFVTRLRKGLGKSRDEIWGKMTELFTGPSLSSEQIDHIEELLYASDLGPQMTQELIDEISKKVKTGELTGENFKQFLFQFLQDKMSHVQQKVDPSLYQFDPNAPKKTKVIMIVGVNGAGKTTTIGKLATKLRQQGANVVVGACDTFRAAAVDQLQVWCDRAGVEMIRAKEGANPSGVGYDALQRAISVGADYCILDTAGRLHTKENLMDELTKSKNVLSKLDSTAPHQVLLVIDAITGQNALRQAQEFNKALQLTGLIFTKCDGSSKAGAAVSIVKELSVPIVYVGVGESVEDLDVFNAEDYLKALIDIS